MFKVEEINKKDKVLIDGIWYVVEKRWRRNMQSPVEKTIVKGYKHIPLQDLIDEVEDHEKWFPRLCYAGARADVEAWATTQDNALVYLEVIGQEYMLRSITSVLMQGRTRQNELEIEPDGFNFSVHRQGYKRKQVSLDDGVAHAILYHNPSIKEQNANILLGRDEKELKNSFKVWLRDSQPLPYPEEAIDSLYERMLKYDRIVKIPSYGVHAMQINVSAENDYEELQEHILQVCNSLNLVSGNMPQLVEITLPQSPLLTPDQVKKIYSTLEYMPKTYDLDGEKIKPVGLKLFNSSFTVYVTESDSCGGLHEQAFGYVVNESDPECSEWGYISIPEYIQNGFEMDLYFGERFIDQDGNLLEKEMAA